MSISQVRTYFRNRLAETDPDLSEWTDGFNIENIPNTITDKTYHIFLGTLASQELNDLTTDDQLAVSINVFFEGYQDVQETLDVGYDLMHQFRLNSINPCNSMVGDNIKNVVLESITPNPVDTNDNMIRFSLDFNVRLVFQGV